MQTPSFAFELNHNIYLDRFVYASLSTRENIYPTHIEFDMKRVSRGSCDGGGVLKMCDTCTRIGG